MRRRRGYVTLIGMDGLLAFAFILSSTGEMPPSGWAGDLRVCPGGTIIAIDGVAANRGPMF
jgi:hypothetical protein